jgi:hypothetical protein
VALGTVYMYADSAWAFVQALKIRWYSERAFNGVYSSVGAVSAGDLLALMGSDGIISVLFVVDSTFISWSLNVRLGCSLQSQVQDGRLRTPPEPRAAHCSLVSAGSMRP